VSFLIRRFFFWRVKNLGPQISFNEWLWRYIKRITIMLAGCQKFVHCIQETQYNNGNCPWRRLSGQTAYILTNRFGTLFIGISNEGVIVKILNLAFHLRIQLKYFLKIISLCYINPVLIGKRGQYVFQLGTSLHANARFCQIDLGLLSYLARKLQLAQFESAY